MDERIERRWVDGAYREVTVPWTLTASGRALTDEQREAAHLVALLEGDASRAEAILDLKAGTVETWLDENENFRRVAMGLLSEHRPAEDRDFDFSKVLKPKQIEAAHLYYEQALTQMEVARRLHVTDRTIRNWAADPAFRRYGEQLRRARNRRLSQELRTQDAEILERLAQQRKAAIEVLSGALGDKNVRVAMELLRPWLKDR